MKKYLLLLIASTFLFAFTVKTNNLKENEFLVDPPAFPGAEGFGKSATGGRGGQIIYVTNLNNSGTGSLRAAVQANGPRIVVFKVSGVIALSSDLKIENGDITIAGQTAPGDGICLKNYSVSVNADNVIIRFLRFRMGDEAAHEGDAIGGRYHENIIVDHCSMSWSTDECVSFYNNTNTSVQWCIISESLKISVHDKGSHGYGGIWGGKNASFHHNLLAHHDSRNPRLGESAGTVFALTDLVDLRNNVIYNWKGNSAYGGEGMNVNIVNCYYKPGPVTTKNTRIISIDKNKNEGTAIYDIWGKFYIDGNFVEGSAQTTNDNWTYGVYNQFHSSYGTVSEADKIAMKLDTPHDIQNNVTTHSAEEAFTKVLAYGGASLVRDTHDIRVTSETENGTYTYTGSEGSTHGIIDSQNDVGGWPTYNSTIAPTDTDNDGMPDAWEDTNGLDKNNASDGVSTSLDGAYTNVEVYINSLVSSIITSQNENSLSVHDNIIDNSTVKVYPVPFQNQFYINFEKVEDVEQVSVYNTMGQEVYLFNTNNIKNQTLKIDVAAKTGNVFIVKIITANGVINKTIIKK